jgi:hypothetical protein
MSFRQLFKLHFGFGKKFVQKMREFNVDEIDKRLAYDEGLETHVGYF